MKQSDVLGFLSVELGVEGEQELAKALKAQGEKGPKFRMNGEKLGYLGITGAIKAVTAEGLKVFTTSKVILVRFADIEKIVKAVPRKKYPKPVAGAIVIEDKEVLAVKRKLDKWQDEDDADEDDEDFDDDDWIDESKPQKKKLPKEKVQAKKNKKPEAKSSGGSIFFKAKPRSK